MYEIMDEGATRLTNVRAILRPNIAVAGGLRSAAREAPCPEEPAVLSEAMPKRKTEFIAGRYYARKALSQLGIQRVAIDNDTFRAPVWPKHITGSISHSVSYCTASGRVRSNVYV